MIADEFFIKGNVPSSKNSRVWTGKYLIPSPTVRRYLRDYEDQYRVVAGEFKSCLKGLKKPYRVAITFHRGTRHLFDLNNACQILSDLMVKHGWIEDDNADVFVPVYQPYVYDKENPGVRIKVLR